LNVQEGNASRVKASKAGPEELRILAFLVSAAKSIEEISRETNVPLQTCYRIIDRLIDVGLIAAEHDSDLYGHETTRFRRHSVV